MRLENNFLSEPIISTAFPFFTLLASHRAARILIAQLPHVKRITEEIIAVVFVPKVIAKQLALMIALKAGLVTVQQVTTIVQRLTPNFSRRPRLIQQLLEEQRNSVSQDEWMDLAERIDNIQGNDVWRSDPNWLSKSDTALKIALILLIVKG